MLRWKNVLYKYGDPLSKVRSWIIHLEPCCWVSQERKCCFGLPVSVCPPEISILYNRSIYPASSPDRLPPYNRQPVSHSTEANVCSVYQIPKNNQALPLLPSVDPNDSREKTTPNMTHVNVNNLGAHCLTGQRISRSRIRVHTLHLVINALFSPSAQSRETIGQGVIGVTAPERHVVVDSSSPFTDDFRGNTPESHSWSSCSRVVCCLVQLWCYWLPRAESTKPQLKLKLWFRNHLVHLESKSQEHTP